MTPFSVRHAAPEDVENAVALLRAQLLEHAIDTAEASLRDLVRVVAAEAQYGFIFLAVANEEAVGIAYAAAHLSAEHGGMSGWLEELYVVPLWRGRGVGSALLTHVIARAQQLRWKALELEVVEGHERTVPLYERHDFRRTARARFTRALT